MSRPTISLLPLEEKDLTAAGDLLHTCKLALPINRLLINGWPNPSVQKPMYHGAIKESFDNPDVIVEKAVDNVKGDLIGFVVFTRKRPSTSDQKDETPNQAPETPPGLNPRVFQTISKTDVELRSSTSKVDHYGELCSCAILNFCPLTANTRADLRCCRCRLSASRDRLAASQQTPEPVEGGWSPHHHGSRARSAPLFCC